jgi:hypothetical protein
MKNPTRPLPLKDAPLQYAPDNELGVVFLFSKIAKRLQFRIEQIHSAYPDCIAYIPAGDSEKRVTIEFEFRSSSFRAHRHDAKKCDYIVCWHHDWPGVPARIKVISLKQWYGAPFKVWIQVAIKSQHHWLDEVNRINWALSPRVTSGDLLLMYRGYPECRITDVFRYSGTQLKRGAAGWREGECYGGKIERVCKLEAPIFLSDMRNHRVLRTAGFIRGNMQGTGGLLVSEYWAYLYEMLCARNPKHRSVLAKFAPEKLSN